MGSEYFQQFQGDDQKGTDDTPQKEDPDKSLEPAADSDEVDDDERTQYDDEALEAAMKHAHEVGINHGMTRAMVIRAYPRPWHVFVDVSPDTDAAFEVAAIFGEEPSSEDLNIAIVECLEGSEREDEIVAQQMQQALEEGQLDNVSSLIGRTLEEGNGDNEGEGDEEEEEE